MSLTWLAAVVAFIMSVVFYAWSIHHGVWEWQFFMLWGLLLWCVSGHQKAP